ncbi:hypothetical protein BGW37DRAFT_517391 [Umbelopsis sp. PMI_123]|nr:hypothetical protein BGW37DRAFT_517391 [Umbelopsis sp. PMI_123]
MTPSTPLLGLSKSFQPIWWTAYVFGLVAAGGPLLGDLIGGTSADSHQPTPSSTILSAAPSLLASSSSPASPTASGLSPHASNGPLNGNDDSPNRPPNVVVTSYVVDSPTTAPGSGQDASNTDSSDDGGQQHLITVVIVICCVVAVTMIAIFIFRRIKLKPSHSFKQKLSSRPASFVTPVQRHDAVFLRELQQV